MTGKVAVVTGASKGIGAGIAKAMAAACAAVVVNYAGSTARPGQASASCITPAAPQGRGKRRPYIGRNLRHDAPVTYDREIHHRRSIRLPGHDYAGGGSYFVTTCAQDGTSLFGEIVENVMVLNEAGQIVEAGWRGLPLRFPFAVLDIHQVMPNHFHGIIVIPGPGLAPALASATGVPAIQPSARRFVGPTLASASAGARQGNRVGLGTIVGTFKSLTAIAVSGLLARRGTRLWQEDYYEHVIRDVDDLERTREYILHNPAKWLEDPDNPLYGQ